MWRGRWAHAAKICAYAVGGGNLILLVLGGPTMLTLSLAVALTPVTLAMTLQLTAFLACGVLSLAVSGRRDRAELLACAIGAAQPPRAGEKYREAMIAEIRAAKPREARMIGTNLMTTAPRTILAAWVQLLKPVPARR
ncbi:MAG: hypothetical protein ACRDR6_11305 [Pseudonocardiaceae bacterium]